MKEMWKVWVCEAMKRRGMARSPLMRGIVVPGTQNSHKSSDDKSVWAFMEDQIRKWFFRRFLDEPLSSLALNEPRHQENCMHVVTTCTRVIKWDTWKNGTIIFTSLHRTYTVYGFDRKCSFKLSRLHRVGIFRITTYSNTILVKCLSVEFEILRTRTQV